MSGIVLGACVTSLNKNSCLSGVHILLSILGNVPHAYLKCVFFPCLVQLF